MERKDWIVVLLVVAMGVHLGFSSIARAQQAEPGQEQKAKIQGKEKGVGAGYVVGGVFATLVNVPLKVGLCGASLGIATVLFVASLGTADRLAADAVKEGCKGPYVIAPKRLKGEQGRGGAWEHGRPGG